TYIRGRVSITVGAIVVRLNQEGFTGSERLYEMRDGLAQGRPVGRGDLEWLNTIIATERGLQTGSLGFPSPVSRLPSRQGPQAKSRPPRAAPPEAGRCGRPSRSPAAHRW